MERFPLVVKLEKLVFEVDRMQGKNIFMDRELLRIVSDKYIDHIAITAHDPIAVG